MIFSSSCCSFGWSFWFFLVWLVGFCFCVGVLDRCAGFAYCGWFVCVFDCRPVLLWLFLLLVVVVFLFGVFLFVHSCSVVVIFPVCLWGFVLCFVVFPGALYGSVGSLWTGGGVLVGPLGPAAFLRHSRGRCVWVVAGEIVPPISPIPKLPSANFTPFSALSAILVL